MRDAFNRIGACTFDTASFGMPLDLLVFWRGQTLLVEIKDGSKPPSRRKLTTDEIRLHEDAASRGVKIHIVETVEQAYALLGTRRAA